MDYITFGCYGLAHTLGYSVLDHVKLLEIFVAFVADMKFDVWALTVADIDVNFAIRV